MKAYDLEIVELAGEKVGVVDALPEGAGLVYRARVLRDGELEELGTGAWPGRAMGMIAQEFGVSPLALTHRKPGA